MLPSNQTLGTRSADKKNVTSTTATAFVQWFLMTRPQASSPTTPKRRLPWVRQAPQPPHVTSKPCCRPGYSMHYWPSLSESISTKGLPTPIHAPIPSPLFQPELIPSEYKKKHNMNKMRGHLECHWLRIYAFLVPSPLFRLQMKRTCSLFNNVERLIANCPNCSPLPPLLWTSFPHPKYATLQSLVYHLDDSLQLPVPTIIFVQLSQNQYDVDDVDDVISNIGGWKSMNCASSDVANCTAEIVRSSKEDGKYYIHYKDGNHERILVRNNLTVEYWYTYCSGNFYGYDGIYSRFGIIDDDRYDTCPVCYCYRPLSLHVLRPAPLFLCHNGTVYWNDTHGDSGCYEHEYERDTSHYREYCEYEFYTEQRGRRRTKKIKFTQCGFEKNYKGRFIERRPSAGFDWQKFILWNGTP